MKLGIMNLSRTPVNVGTNSNCTEIINICNQLNDRGVDCTVINSDDIRVSSNSLFLDYEPPFKSVKCFDLKDLNDYDAILVMNSHSNFFGGEKSDEIIDKVHKLATFNGPIYYLYNDNNLKFEQLWRNIERRKWNTLKEEDVNIKNKFYVISQFRDIDKAIQDNSKQITVTGGKFIDFGVWRLKDCQFINNIGQYDLIYGGSFRGGRREEKYKDFFFNKDLNVAIYGTMKLNDFEDQTGAPENWLGKVKSDNVINENALGKATVICSEKGYNDNIETIRIYESILSNAITFIDEEFDPRHTIYGESELYVKDGNDLESKIKSLTPEKIKQYQQEQRNYIERKQKVDYIQELIDYIEETK